MSLSDAKRMLQWNTITEALTEAGVDADAIALVEQARAVSQTVHSMAQALLDGADTKTSRRNLRERHETISEDPMGEYWKPVNVTRREYIHPHDLNCGLKLQEWSYPESRVMKLIAERWNATDVVVAVSDYDNTVILHGSLVDEAPAYGDLDDEYKRIR